MTENEAIEDIKENILPCIGGKTLVVAINELEKQIPNKAIREEDDEMETDWFRCPVCNIGLGWEHAMKKIKYCYNCGQHIDTSEIDFYGENI